MPKTTEKLDLESCLLSEATHLRVGEELFGPGSWDYNAVGIRLRPEFDRWTQPIDIADFSLYSITPMRIKQVSPRVTHFENVERSVNTVNGIVLVPLEFVGKEVWVSDQEPTAFKVSSKKEA